MSLRCTPSAPRRANRWQFEWLRTAVCAALIVLPLLGNAMRSQVHAQPLDSDETRFETYDVRIDPKGRALAAYQIEVYDASGAARIVGIEGGAHPAFAEPPYFDPAAMQHDRVILAAFQVSGAVPEVETRVATLHVEVPRGAKPDFQVLVEVATTGSGEEIPVAASVSKHEPQ